MDTNNVLMDDKQISARIRQARENAHGMERDREAFEKLRARWEQQRKLFFRSQRAESGGRLRNRPTPLDSDEVFDVTKPPLNYAPPQSAVYACHTTNETVTVRKRLEQERKEQRPRCRGCLRDHFPATPEPVPELMMNMFMH